MPVTPGWHSLLQKCGPFDATRGCAASTPLRWRPVTRRPWRSKGKPVSISALYPLLAQLHGNAPRDKVALYADAKAPYGLMIRVLDAAKAGGIPDVSFVTQ